MPGRPAARVLDPTAHGQPLSVKGPGSSDVLIGKKKAWRGLTPLMMGKFLQTIFDTEVKLKLKDMIRTSKPDLYLAIKIQEKDDIKASAQVDFHSCSNQKIPPAPPDLMGAVINGSSTVFINGLAACREGDTIQEVAITNKIMRGCHNVRIGG